MKNTLPNIRILRRSVYVNPSVWSNGFENTEDILQYKDGNGWKDIPVQADYQIVNKKKTMILGNSDYIYG